ncbi:MAG: hypothetical protein ACFFD6_04685 [Candidatus Thorarchaeota archaeon]
MYGIMLVNHAGETVASVGWENLEGDATLFGGFLSAVQIFIKKISGGTEVEELRFGNMKLLIGSANEYHVVTLHEASAEHAEAENREVTRLVGESMDATQTNGFLELVKEMITRDMSTDEDVSRSVRDWTKSVEDKKKAAIDWGKTVL